MTISSLEEARFNKSRDVGSNSIETMLRVLLARIERGDINPSHVIACCGYLNEDGSVDTEWLQEGSFQPFAQIGLLARVQAALLQPA